MMTLFYKVFALLVIVSQPAFTASVPSIVTLHAYNNSLNDVQRYFWDFSFHRDHLEIFISTKLPIEPTSFAEGIDNGLSEVKVALFERGDPRLMCTTSWTTGGCSIEIRVMGRSLPFMRSDLEEVQQGLTWTLVDKKRFFESFFYLRTHGGVAFAEGIITAGELPPGDGSLKNSTFDLS